MTYVAPCQFLLKMVISTSWTLLTIIQEHVGYIYWWQILKNQTFKNFHAWIDNQTQACIGAFHLDSGKEYTSNEFEYYLSKHGITHQTSAPYNPQQNGVAERMNRTLMNMARSMMFCKNAKLMFWGDVLQECKINVLG